MTGQAGEGGSKEDIPTNRQKGRKGMQDELGTRPSKNKGNTIRTTTKKNDTNQEGRGQ